MTPDRRSTSSDLAKWISIAVGAFSIVGVLVGAAVTYGQHLRADADQDNRISHIEQRIYDLERAERFQHGDTGMLPHAPDTSKPFTPTPKDR